MPVSDMGRGTQPFKVLNIFPVYFRMDICGLRSELRFGMRACNGLRQHVRRRTAQRKIDIGKMLAIELIQFAIVRGMVLRAIPPIPVTTFRDQQFFISQGGLLCGNLVGIGGKEIACCSELVPRYVIFRRADPNIEIRVDP